MGVERALRRTLWCEALYEAFPNRFTLWLWKRAGNQLRALRDRGLVTARPARHSANDWYGIGGLFDGLVSAKAAKAQRAAHRPPHLLEPEDYWASMQQAGLQNAYQQQMMSSAQQGLLNSGIAQQALGGLYWFGGRR